MMSNEDIGYLKRAVEDLSEVIITHTKQQESDNKDIRIRLSFIEKELSMYKTIYKSLRLVGAIALLIITFKFGDIPTLLGK